MTEELLQLFTDAAPVSVRTVDSSRGEGDFRETVIAEYAAGDLPEVYRGRIVVKAAANGFTTPERIAMWARCADEYRKLGAYCPQILPTCDGTFPYVTYRGRRCAVYAETFAEYPSADTFPTEQICTEDGTFCYIDDAIRLNARVAAAHFDFTKLPSAWCMYETFDPSDKVDEVEENARAWITLAEKMPPQFRTQAATIIARWYRDRAALAGAWRLLPRSVFQADLNPTNCLLDADGRFVGLYDFNIAGSEVYLNYLFREIPYVTRNSDMPLPENHEAESILHALQIAREYYRFSDAECMYAPLIWRVVKPLWFTEVQRLRAAGDDVQKIAECLARVEKLQTRSIPFADSMR